MPRYRVPMIEVATVTWSYWATVEADNEEEAKHLAMLNEVDDTTPPREISANTEELHVDQTEGVQVI